MAVVERAAPHLIGTSGDSLREAFGKALVEWSRERPNIVVLDADIAGGTGVHHFRKAQPHRFFQFGIAEQNMMAAAGGMAATGLIPIVTTFAVFCLRAYRKLPGLYDARVKAAVLGHERAGAETSLTLSGVSFANARAVAQRYLEAIAWAN